MKPTTFLHEKLGFTHTEVRVVVFLGWMLLAGLGVRWARERYFPDDHQGIPTFDYTRDDSVFIARSELIDSLEAPPAPPSPGHRSKTASGTLQPNSIDLNAATREQLIQLPGIGPQFADRILRFREEHGPFGAIDDLTRVRGIGPKKLAKIRPFVRPL
jgi:competence ComEA-like helix-hairpin-helix protein